MPDINWTMADYQSLRNAALEKISDLTNAERIDLAHDCAERLVALAYKFRCGAAYGTSDIHEAQQCADGLNRISLYPIDVDSIYKTHRQWLADLEAQWCDVCEDTKADCYCWRR